MRKYSEIAKTYMKTQLAWRADVIFNMIFTAAKILFAYLLWGIIFSERNEVSGFTFHSMLSYYIVSSFLSQLEMSEGISGEITARIRNGTFSNYMELPVNIEWYFVAMEAGVAAFYFFFDLAAVLVWICVFHIRFVLVKDIFLLVCALLTAVIGMLFMVQLNYFLGILTLKYQEISTFLTIKNNLISLVTGSIIPLALFPEAVVKGMKLLPFYYVNYLPSMLLTGRCENEALTGLAVLLVWCALMQALYYCMEVIIRAIAFYGIWKVIFYCFLPYGIMATLPVQSMIGEMNWKLGAFGIAVVCVFCLATCLVWKTGIRHYNSASS